MQNVAVKSQDERPEPEDEMRVRTLILILSLLAVVLGACDRSKDSAAGVGPIARVLPQGRNGPWLGEMTDAAYRMTNTQDPATIQYYFLDPVPGTEGRRSVSVEIAIESRGEGTRAGLVYGVTANPTTYYFYLLEPDGRVVLFFRESTGALTEVWNSRTNRRAGDFVTLALEENGGQLRLLVDGAQAGMIRSKIGGRGGVGIAAGGTGRFAFANFQHAPAPSIPGAPVRAADRARGSRGEAHGLPAGWRRHETPGVFSLSHPEGWRVAFDARNGYVKAFGNNQETAYVWPVFSRRPLGKASASVLLARMASRLVPGARWREAVSVGANALRIESRSGGMTTVASLRWFSNQNGSAALCYVSSAPSTRYSDQADTIARILASFRPIIPNAARAAAGTRKSRPAVQFTGWQDPNERAFHAQVPAGWRVDGGLQRRTALDYQRGISLTSPDGELTVFLMDRGIPFFTLPDQTTAMLGMREGSWYTAPDGTRMLIRRYLAGVDFAQEYVTNRFAKVLPNFRVERRQNRPDLAAAVEQEHAGLNAAAAGFMRHRATAGEAFFGGRRAGRGYSGYVAATTVLAESQIGGVWEVRQLYGLLAPSDRVGEAATVMERLVASFRWNSDWYLRQHKTRADVGGIMERYGRRMSEIINATFGAAGRRADRTADRFSEYIRGSVTVQDERGERFEVWNTSNYYWIDVFNDVTGTMLSPNLDVSRLRELVAVR